MSKITHIGRNFSDMNSDSKKPWELFPGLAKSALDSEALKAMIVDKKPLLSSMAGFVSEITEL